MRIPGLPSLLFLMLLSCSEKKQIQPSFYFWRTSASLSATEQAALQHYQVRRLYTRFFDVDFRDTDKEPVPLGVIDSLELLPQDQELVPVVFITNRSFLRMRQDKDAEALAQKVLKKINGLYKSYQELQMDCDWSDKTRARYFLFLRTLKQALHPGIRLSATIRLHQVKYPGRTGIPPVDGGMLMFYNMGRISDMDGPNSIFDAATAKAYTASIKSYRLHLDAALPIFRWYIHYRNGHVQGLISKKQLPDIQDTSYFYTGEISNHFVVKQALIQHGVSYEPGDVLKHEALDDKALLEAAKLLKENLYEEDRTIILYDLDDLNLNTYETHTLEAVFSTFR